MASILDTVVLFVLNPRIVATNVRLKDVPMFNVIILSWNQVGHILPSTLLLMRNTECTGYFIFKYGEAEVLIV